jgi:nitrite reductase/ring-hydroxylating ferredoxin subunit
VSDSYTRVAAIGEIGDGEMNAIKLSGIEAVAIYNVAGRYYATQDLCSHAAASLSEGWLMDHEVICPVHEGRFDVRDGQPLCFPVTDALRTFPVLIRDNSVWVDLSSALPDRAK